MGHHLRKLTTHLPLATAITILLGPAAAQAPAQATTPAPSLRAGATTLRPVIEERPRAQAAREVNLQETGHLHVTGEPGDTFYERGSATGTYSGSITGRLTIVSANKVTATFTVRTKGGSITGTGSARFAQQGTNGYFGGTISITNGTGSFAHASRATLGISGVISRETFALTVHVHGKIHV